MTDDTLLTGELVKVDGHDAIAFERRLSATPDRVWRAVTDESEMAAWFPCHLEGERRVGASVRFRFDGADGEPEEGRVTSWDPPRSWTFEWGGSTVHIEVVPDADGSLLRFSQQLPGRAGAARQGAGWHVCLDRLAHHLDDAEPPTDDAWKAYYGEYLERMPAPVAELTHRRTLTWDRLHHAPPDRVWRALTDSDEVSTWWGHHITLDVRLGGIVHFDFRPEAEPFDGVVVVVEEGRRLAYTFGDIAIVEWVVEPHTHGTRFTLSQHDVDASVAGDDQYGAADLGAGWHGILDQLDLYLAAGFTVPDEGEERRRPLYEELLR